MGVGQGARRDYLGTCVLNMNEAFAAYENVRHRLPEVSRGGACQRMPHLEAIADQIDVFLLDAFGVLNIGETAIDGVPERVARLQKAGKRVVVVSNAAGYPHGDLMAKYARLGYDFAPEDVITSRKTILHGLRSEPPRRWGLMANKALGGADLEGLDVTYLEDSRQAYDQAEAFLMLGSAVWTEARQAMLVQSLRDNPRPVYVGNPDIVAPRETGFSTEPGHFAHELADATGIAPQFFGKPFGNIFDLTFARLGNFDPDRTVMVGDSLHTDILGGQAAGLKTALISGYGFFAGHDVDAPIQTSGIQPDFILDRP
ncbi:HAD superfamily hydrolase (TIGR01459 family) [Sulfitobacter mediterraneus]|uniref:HAD superfamily hydrolase (TIGR01459 family) n=2 Tax=Sulfitobacter mediterraneus TaxID=83219 RepID=A0A2T6CD29_9RHOB|nr:HAD-IIA family hydrolase [Sulfitobacter mediterraneus]PTX73418.1 HAD superfamily hydrolase (TIGR01459 family) [Sulfitobacter mediterraneus]